MKNTIYFFSPTGTCRRVAGVLASAGGGTAVDLTVSQGRAGAPTPGRGELLTLVFPVYAQRMPALLRQWLLRAPVREGPACLVGVYGSVGEGNALPRAAGLLRRMGRRVVAAAALPGPHSFDCAPTRRSLRCADGWLEEDLTAFYCRALEKAALGGGAVSLPRRPAVGGLPPQNFLPRLGSPYPAPDLEKCTGCGRCADLCPTGAAAGRRRDCIRCTACIRACHVGARGLRFRTGIPERYLSAHIARPKEAEYVI